MTDKQDDIEANLKRRNDILILVDKLQTRINLEVFKLAADADGTGKDRNPDLQKVTKRQLKADIDDTLLCMLKFEGEATECRKQALILQKEYERRR